ncbi:MAG: phosphate uptake regulator PhoU [Nitrosarchaeum sp.]|uniref:phosphate signaling complex PhoU family protein n=1 Tax=Nitrosarchaeum sp. TaxID=2026886 RepID=UPI002DE48EA5|nr:phosphate uptake regulator PhoU [Nitrosarchaeum sp.]
MKLSENTKQTRKIQLSGGSTYIISMPKEWIEELKIKVGENVTIVKNSNKSLTLFPREHGNDKNQTTATIISSQKDSGESVKRKIIAAYLAGYKTIQIKTKGMKIPSEHSRSIRELVHSSMIGTEIVESSSEAMTIQILTRLPELSFESALKRMHLMAINMIKEAIESLEEKDIPHADEVINMDDEVDRFGLYMRRNLVLAIENQSILEDMGLKRPSDCLEYRTIVGKIERIGDHASLIAKRIKFIEDEIDLKTISKIKKLSEKALEVFEESMMSVQNHDFQKAENVAEKVSKIIEEEKEIMSKINDNGKNSTVIKFILEDLRRIIEYSGDIAEVAIDENIQSIISEE